MLQSYGKFATKMAIKKMFEKVKNNCLKVWQFAKVAVSLQQERNKITN
jgi:hypothetical protein